MSSVPVTLVQSRDNAFVNDLRRLAQDSTAYRKQGRLWLEGDHLCRAALARGLRPAVAVFSESFWPLAPTEWAQCATKIIVLSDALFADISALESPAAMGYVLELPAPQPPDPQMPSGLCPPMVVRTSSFSAITTESTAPAVAFMPFLLMPPSNAGPAAPAPATRKC